MTEYIRQAKLAYLTEPEPGVFILNLQFEGEPGISRGVATFERVQINRDQLCLLAESAVPMALSGRLE